MVPEHPPRPDITRGELKSAPVMKAGKRPIGHRDKAIPLRH